MPDPASTLQSHTMDAAELRAAAETDLLEKPSARKKALREMRSWLRNQTNLQHCRTDSNFLLRFLRMQKFQVKEAQAVLEKYLRMRTQHPNWFQNLDVRDPKLNDLLRRGYIYLLPERDAKGRRVVFSRAAAMDANVFTAGDVLRAHILTFEALLMDEEVQINGITYVFDEKGVNWSHVSIWSPSEVSKAFSCCERAMPLRHREIHLVQLPWAMSLVFQFAKSLLSQKLRDRFLTHSDFDNLACYVPRDILPKEYGGSHLSANDMIDQWMQLLDSRRAAILGLDKMKHALYKTVSGNSELHDHISVISSSEEDEEDLEDNEDSGNCGQEESIKTPLTSKLRRASGDCVLEVVGSMRKMEL